MIIYDNKIIVFNKDIATIIVTEKHFFKGMILRFCEEV